MSVHITPKNSFVEAFISLIHGDYEVYLKEISTKTYNQSDRGLLCNKVVLSADCRDSQSLKQCQESLKRLLQCEGKDTNSIDADELVLDSIIRYNIVICELNDCSYTTALEHLSQWILSIPSTHFSLQVLFLLLKARILLYSYQVNDNSPSILQNDYLSTLNKVNSIVDAHVFPSSMKQGVMYILSLLFSIYYCENCTVKSAKKWVSAMNQAAGASNEQYFSLIAEEIRKEMHDSFSSPVLCLSSLLPSTKHEYVNAYLVKARLEYCRGNYVKVLSAREQNYSDASPNEPFSLSLLGCSLFALQKRRMARFYFERCSSTCTEVYQQKLISINLGRVYESIGNYEQAVKFYGKALREDQQNPILNFHYGECMIHLINKGHGSLTLIKEVYSVYLNVISIIKMDDEYFHILILTYYRLIEVSFFLYMFPRVDEYCKEILSITQTKRSLLDQTGRFCSTQIKLFCVYMQARSRIRVSRWDDALSILLPKELDSLYPPEVSNAISTNSCTHLNRIHNDLILRLLELIYYIYERLEDFDHAQTMAEILVSIDPSIERWKRYLKISVYTGDYGRACLKYCSYIKDHL